jgi:tetratricopeptide (TPR) repeat protein
MRSARVVLPILLALACIAPVAVARTLPDVRAMVESHAPGALAAAEALCKETPKDSNAWVMLARARLHAKQSEKAIVAAEQAVAHGPGNAQAYYWLGNAYGNRIGEVGVFGKMMMAPKLRDAFEQAVKLDPSLIDARSSLIEFYLLAPDAMGGGVDKARAQAVAIGKYDRVEALIATARIAMHEKKAAQAIKAYEEAHALKPKDPQIRLMLILGYQQTERWKDAFAAAKQWTLDEPKKAKAWYQIGRIAAESGQFAAEGGDALRTYLSLVREPGDPEPKHVHYRLGQIFAKAGRKDEARAEWRAALKIDPKYTEAKIALAAP